MKYDQPSSSGNLVETQALVSRESDQAFWNQFSHSTAVKHDKQGAEISALGAITQLTLPPGWIAGREQNAIRGFGYKHEYVKPGEHAKITASYSGAPINDSDGASFVKLLERPPHKLSTDELNSQESVLGTRSSSANFIVKSAYTKRCGGQNVLMVEGHHPNSGLHSQDDELVMLIPSDRKGTVVQEVSYQAPHDEFGTYLRQVRAAFDDVTLR